MGRALVDRRRAAAVQSWRQFVLPVTLAFAVGISFTLGVVLLDIPDAARNPLPRIGPPPTSAAQLVVPDGTLAEIGAFMAYRGYAAITLTLAATVLIMTFLILTLFVRERPVRRILLAVLTVEIAAGVLANLMLGSGMSAAIGRMRCTAAAAPPWDVCSIEKIAHWPFTLHYGFNAVIDAICVAATAAAVFVIFIVASIKPPQKLPPIVGSAERCVTVLLVAASLLLVAVALIDKAFLHWSFARYLVLDHPPADVSAYMTGISTMNGALETALLAVTWFISLLLLARSGQGPAEPDQAFKGLSAYNLSAILAPALSAIAANLLSGQ